MAFSATIFIFPSLVLLVAVHYSTAVPIYGLETTLEAVPIVTVDKRFYPISAIGYDKNKRYFFPQDMDLSRLPVIPLKETRSRSGPEQFRADPYDQTEFVIHFGKRFIKSYEPGEELALSFGKRRR